MIRCRQALLVRVPSLLLAVVAVSCGAAPNEVPGETPLTRTEFTDRIENFFEYDSLRAGRESRFLIHLTDLREGSPVQGADVVLRLLSSERIVAETTAVPGPVAGIYVAAIHPPESGACDVEFSVRSDSVDETMRLTGFTVQ